MCVNITPANASTATNAMHERTASLPPGEPDPALLEKLAVLQQACLLVTALMALIVFAGWLFPLFAAYLPNSLTRMSIPMALVVLLCALSLAISEPRNHLSLPRASRYIATQAGLLSILILLESTFRLFPAVDVLLEVDRAPGNTGRLPVHSPAAFVVLSVSMVLVTLTGPLLRRIADGLVPAMCLVTLILLSENLFGAIGLLRLSANNMISPLLLMCLVLLTFVVAMRQAERGVWSIFVGAGIGSRIARGFAPVLLIIPFLIEVARSRIIPNDLVPEQYGAAILTSLAALLSMVLLLVLVWRINTMEKEIHDLTLRDELTGLYNMRGFYLLGEQTLRLAQRAELPFSVLFIDLDGLKKINDDLGHNTGSSYLAETGEVVMACFRETDVKGRFGGDEFVVAGQFSMVGIELAATRLRTMAEQRNVAVARKYPLSLSVGYVTLDHPSNESLKELVRRADEAMYRDKRSKKVARA
ncbi:MAG: GGDEF domain-containing protein [Terracidiphilus sp.]